MTNKKILIIYTGGTIGMTEQYPGGPLTPFDFQNILEHLPELKKLTETIDIAPFPHPLDSSDVDPIVWTKIATIINDHYTDYDAFVVLHGTDTMAYTASALSFMLRNLNKPIIFTGSQLPIGKIRTDGKENLITAIEIACAERNHQPLIQEVTICFGAHLYRANRTTKFSAEGFEAFQSPNFPSLAQVGVHIQFREELLLQNNTSLLFNEKLEPNIGIIKIFPGIQNHYFDALSQSNSIQGLIIESYGSGTIPQKEWLLRGIEQLIEKGVTILNISQCPQGLIDHSLYKNAQKLFEMGVLSGQDMTTETAVAKMMHVLSLPLSREEKNNLLITSLAGELTPARLH